MIKDRRQKRILEMLATEGSVELAELARSMPEISRVTLRRDMAELAEAGALKRTHGGAVLPDATILRHPAADTRPTPSGVDELDAVVLPPISGKGADALRRQIARRGIPFLAESAAQPGGIYLGPDNFEASRALGRLAGSEHSRTSQRLRILVIGHPELSNTRARADGFLAGVRDAFDGPIEQASVNGQGNYRSALRVATDALATSEPFDIVFAVNDHSAVAGAEAAAEAGAEIRLYATGGESPDFVAKVSEPGPLRAVASFFPEVVGALAIDRLTRALSDGSAPDGTQTPHAIVTAENLTDHFAPGATGWALREDRRTEMTGDPADRASAGRPRSGRVRVGIMPHFPAHDWYRAMIQSMGERATESGIDLVVTPPHQGIAAEISRLRSEIAKTAAGSLEAGETIVLGEGEATICLAAEIRRIAFSRSGRLSGLTVITNALDVLLRLDGGPGIRTILTSGEYQSADRCLVGPSVGALFERVRADRAFVSVAGVSDRFGISALDERRALAGARLCAAARQTVALADHTLVGTEATHRILRIEDLDMVITDDGTMASDRQALRAAGVEVLVAGEARGPTMPQIRSADGRQAHQL